jgi:hypothetical protein
MIATAPAIDPNKNWVFHFGSSVKNETPIKIMQDRYGVISFSIPYDGLRKIHIELLSRNVEEKLIEGKYSIGSSRLKENILFNVLNDGELVRGHPQGSLSRHVWSISTKD